MFTHPLLWQYPKCEWVARSRKHGICIWNFDSITSTSFDTDTCTSGQTSVSLYLWLALTRKHFLIHMHCRFSKHAICFWNLDSIVSKKSLEILVFISINGLMGVIFNIQYLGYISYTVYTIWWARALTRYTSAIGISCLWCRAQIQVYVKFTRYNYWKHVYNYWYYYMLQKVNPQKRRQTKAASFRDAML